MQRILPLMLLAVTLFLVACGGGDDKKDSGKVAGGTAIEGDADVNTVLGDVFTPGGAEEIKSGNFSLDVAFDSPQTGEGSLSISGPFEDQGETKLPLLDMLAEVSAQGQSVSIGFVNTGDKGFTKLQLPGDDGVVAYSLTDEAYAQLDEAQTQAQSQAGDEGLTDLPEGVNPREWLTDPTIADPDSEVEGTPTVRITGGLDAQALIDDVDPLLEKLGGLGAAGAAEVPSKLTDEQKTQFTKALQGAQVEIEAGKDDSVLRRLKLTAGSADAAALPVRSLEYSLGAANQKQDIEAPSDPKPFEEFAQRISSLLGLLQGSGALGGLTAP